MKTICIMCPIGCEIEVDEKTNTVTGNLCPRGKEYGLNEITNPKRVVTSVIKTSFGTISVKTSTAIDKNCIYQCLEKIKEYSKNNNIDKNTLKIGDTLLTDIFGANIVVTGIFIN